jgi:hypothetical protein
MNRMTNVSTKVLALLPFLLIGAAAIEAQGLRPDRVTAAQGRDALDGAGVTPAEIQRMFDAYALVQAQDQLGIGDEQFSRFLVRYKALQDIRRESLQQRTRLVAELRRLLAAAGQPDETQLTSRMETLAALETRTNDDLRQAYDDIDQVLDVRQRASFRVFEETMERRKVELITRARQVNRGRQ